MAPGIIVSTIHVKTAHLSARIASIGPIACHVSTDLSSGRIACVTRIAWWELGPIYQQMCVIYVLQGAKIVSIQLTAPSAILYITTFKISLAISVHQDAKLVWVLAIALLAYLATIGGQTIPARQLVWPTPGRTQTPVHVTHAPQDAVTASTWLFALCVRQGFSSGLIVFATQHAK